MAARPAVAFCLVSFIIWPSFFFPLDPASWAQIDLQTLVISSSGIRRAEQATYLKAPDSVLINDDKAFVVLGYERASENHMCIDAFLAIFTKAKSEAHTVAQCARVFGAKIILHEF